MPNIFQDVLSFLGGSSAPAAQQAVSSINQAETDIENAADAIAVDLANEVIGKIPFGSIAEPFADKLIVGLINSFIAKLSPSAPVTVTVAPKPAPVPDEPPQVTMEPIPNS